MDRIEMLSLLKEARLSPLEISIKKWVDIVFSDGEEQGGNNCALCEIYAKHRTCFGCPIYNKTKLGNCNKTPFRILINHQEKEKCDGIKLISLCNECLNIAKRELVFLKNLKE